MPYVFDYVIFPLNKANEVANKWIEAIKDFRSEARPLAKEVVPNAVKVTMEGIESIGVHDVKEGKLDDFLTVLGKSMMVYHDIEGFKYRWEVRATVTEALGLLGMKAPE